MTPVNNVHTLESKQGLETTGITIIHTHTHTPLPLFAIVISKYPRHLRTYRQLAYWQTPSQNKISRWVRSDDVPGQHLRGRQPTSRLRWVVFWTAAAREGGKGEGEGEGTRRDGFMEWLSFRTESKSQRFYTEHILMSFTYLQNPFFSVAAPSGAPLSWQFEWALQSTHSPQAFLIRPLKSVLYGCTEVGSVLSSPTWRGAM